MCALAGEWAALCDRSNATVFQRPEWLIPWWEHSGSGRLTLVVFRSGDDLVGLAPLFLHEWQGRRQVTLVGNGVSDYLDVIGAPECASAAIDFLDEQREEWDLCDWQDLPATSPLIAAAEASRLQHSICRLPAMHGNGTPGVRR